MTLPQVHGEYGVVMEPELKFNDAGGAWLKMRCKATSRKQVDGVWVDGDILFIDILASKKLAENTYEMVQRGWWPFKWSEITGFDSSPPKDKET